jgi:hypothetical protein
VYVWGELDVWIGKHNLWIISLFHLFIAAICLSPLCLHEQLIYLLNIWLFAYLCGVDQVSIEYPTWGGNTSFDP